MQSFLLRRIGIIYMSAMLVHGVSKTGFLMSKWLRQWMLTGGNQQRIEH
jgi:hypothetical protein